LRTLAIQIPSRSRGLASYEITNDPLSLGLIGFLAEAILPSRFVIWPATRDIMNRKKIMDLPGDVTLCSVVAALFHLGAG